MGSHLRNDSGAALVLALVCIMLLLGLGAGLVVSGNLEGRLAGNFRSGVETFYAADAGLELAFQELASVADWSDALSGVARSSLTSSVALPILPSGARFDLDRRTHDLQAQSDAESPPGASRPVWRAWLWGPLSAVEPAPAGSVSPYLVVWVADDDSDADGQPLRDANGVLRLHAEGYAPFGPRRAIDSVVARPAALWSGTNPATSQGGLHPVWAVEAPSGPVQARLPDCDGCRAGRPAFSSERGLTTLMVLSWRESQ